MPDSTPPDARFRMAIARRPSPFGVVAWSPDGTKIAAAGGVDMEGDTSLGDGLIWVWTDGEPQPVLLEGHRGSVTALAWSPDGSTVASGSDDHTVRLWDAATGSLRLSLEGHGEGVLTVAWSPDGQTVASGSADKTVRLWDAAIGRPRFKLEGHGMPVRTVTFSPNGRIVASGSRDRTVRLWNATSGRPRYTLAEHGADWIRTVAWSPDGRIVASASDDHTVRMWNVATGRLSHTLEGHQKSVRSVAWSPDGRTVASGSIDRTVRLWDVATGRLRLSLEGHEAGVLTVAWSPDGHTVASGSMDRTVRLWNAATGRLRHSFEGHEASVLTVVWSPNGPTVASGSDDHTVRVWDSANERLRRTLEGHRKDWARTVAWSPDGRTIASRSEYNVLQLLDAATGQPNHALEGHEGSALTVAWSPDGRAVASGCADGMVRIWDAATGHLSHILEGHQKSVLTVAWSPDGSIVASGSADKSVRLWDAATGRLRFRLEGHEASVLTVAWSPDGRTVASGCVDSSVRIWDAATGRPRRTLEGHRYWVLTVAWSPDGNAVASGSGDDTVLLWDWATGRPRFKLEGHEATVCQVAWSRDGLALASLSDDCELCIWDAQTGQLLHRRPPLSYRYMPAGLAPGLAPAEWNCDEYFIANFQPPSEPTTLPDNVLQASAKIVLAGDSDAGKTCLARRLVEDRFEDGQPTTHGMQVWTMPAATLHPDGAAPEGQLREVFLWDLGGQDEYHLVNQLFLHDTSIALVLFDPTRGSTGLQHAEDWDERLRSRASHRLRKLLIRAQADKPGAVSDGNVEALRRRLDFSRCIAVSSARDGDPGIAELRQALHDAIDWDHVTLVSRPPTFQKIRDLVVEARQSGECLLHIVDVSARLAARAIEHTPGELETTLGHLVREGEIVDLVLQTGDRVLVLRIDVISSYAGSLVLSARTNPQGVPVIEQDRILSASMTFPGMEAAKRITPRAQERAILECVVRLMVDRGLCFNHQGLLVFPTLFNDLAPLQGELPLAPPIYYDFNGPIDNIYAALVSRLAVSQRFGPVRLWARYAEFGDRSAESCGIRRADKSKTRGHLDLYFGPATGPDQRRLFRDFVDDHLKSEGVKILSGLAFSCHTCSFEFSEGLLNRRLSDNRADVTCPQCDEKYALFAVAQEATPESERRLAALKTDVEELQKLSRNHVVANVAKPKSRTGEPIKILHLSDLHFTAATNIDAVLQPLEADLHKLRVSALDYLVISGDFADQCNEVGWSTAARFVEELRSGFGLDSLRIIIAPGNHDYAQRNDHFDFHWNSIGTDATGNPMVGATPVPNTRYRTRFSRFGTFYHNLYSAKPYEEDPAKQFHVIEDPDRPIRFLALNSAWEIDQFHKERISLNNDAVSAALRSFSNPELHRLGILVWHHAVTGDRKVADTQAIQRLGDAGFRILLHGDVHEVRDDLTHYLDPKRRIHVIGGGTFGALANDRPESTPRLYSLLTIAPDLSSIQVVRRCQKTVDGPYEAYAVYPAGDENTKRADYRIEFAAP